MILRNVHRPAGRSTLALMMVALLLTASIGVRRADAQADQIGMDVLTPLGAFRIDSAEFGVSDVNYAVGPIGYHEANDSLFVAGHPYDNAVAEFGVPDALGAIGTAVADLPVVEDALQPFAPMLDRAPTGNPDQIDRINGLFVDADGRLIVNAEQWYDADGGAQDTTVVIENADALDGEIDGYYRLDGAVHAGGYLSPVPEEWRESLGGPVLTGWASNTSIISRHSVGPTLFTLDPAVIPADAQANPVIATTRHMDFPFQGGHYLDPDALETSEGGASDLWNHLAKARYGFIVPGTSTFMVLGSIGGVDSGIGYKITQDNGNLCGGYCAYRANDYDNAYWLFDLDEILAADEPHLPRPYDHGTFDVPYDDEGRHSIIGATFDPTNNRLFISLENAGQVGDYDRPPLIVMFDVATGSDDQPMPTPSPTESGGPEPTPAPPVDTGTSTVQRVAGLSRSETAVELSQISYPNGADVVVLARQDQYPDALAGGPLATRLGGPILLTETDSLSPITSAEIQRLAADEVVVLGGSSAVSGEVIAELADLGVSVRRIAGMTRFATAALIAAEFDDVDVVYLTLGADRVDEEGVVVGDGWPDAVGVAALAAREGRPILLATLNTVPEDASRVMRDIGVEEVVLVGGTSAILPGVQASLEASGFTTDRIAGASRFETAGEVVDRAVAVGADPTRLWIATGRAFPDALTAGPAVAADGGVMLLAEDGQLSANDEIIEHLTTHGGQIETVRLIGGEAAISAELEGEIDRALAGSG